MSRQKEVDTLFTYCYEAICWNFIVKAGSVLGKVKFDEKIYRCEDFVFKFGLYSYIKSFSYMPQVLYHNRIRENSATSTVKPEHIENEYLKYNHMMKDIQKGNYPDGACRIPNSILIAELGNVVRLAFDNKIGLKCDYSIIQKYRDTDTYRYALKDYDERFIKSRASRCYVRCINKWQFTIIYLWIRIRGLFDGRRRQSV